MKTNYTHIYMGLIFTLIISACSKEWLDIKPDKSLVVPYTLKDLQALLNDANVMNIGCCRSGLRSSEQVYMADDDLGSLSDVERDMYSFSREIRYSTDNGEEWRQMYAIVNSANIVFDELKKFDPTDPVVRDLRGQAHFFRALAYFNLAQMYCKPYIMASAGSDLGLPLRYTSDINHIESRSTLEQVYQMINSDLEYASNSLPFEPKNIFSASKTAALALSAKVYLTMENYPKAKLYADSVLDVKGGLIDFNNPAYVSASFPYRFQPDGNGNPEIIFYAFSGLTYFEGSYLGNILQVSSAYYSSYSDDDLRKHLFFGFSGPRLNFAGSYSGRNNVFQGISTNEMYFIRLECNARANNLEAARDDLNLILKNRYRTGSEPTITEDNQEALLRIIVSEKIKEFPRIANIYWEDIRRLNLDPRFQRTLTRTVNGQVFTLPPNDPRFVFPLPLKEITLSNLEQNQR